MMTSDLDLVLDVILERVEPRLKQTAIRSIRDAGKQPPRWTADEDMLLQSCRGLMSLTELSKELGRTPIAVALRGKRVGAATPRRTPGYLTGRQIAKIVGVEDRIPSLWIRQGILPGEQIPYDFGPPKWRVKIQDFKRWLIRPSSWVYFRLERMRPGTFRRLVELAQARWGDEWWTTRQAADYLGTTCNLIVQQIKRGRIRGTQAPNLSGRHAHTAWAVWWVRKSEIIGYRTPTRTDSRCKFSPAADAFMLKARIEWGLTPAVIGRMMKKNKKTIEYRLDYLCRREGIELEKLTGKTPRVVKKWFCGCGKGYLAKRSSYCPECRRARRQEVAEQERNQ